MAREVKVYERISHFLLLLLLLAHSFDATFVPTVFSPRISLQFFFVHCNQFICVFVCSSGLNKSNKYISRFDVYASARMRANEVVDLITVTANVYISQ